MAAFTAQAVGRARADARAIRAALAVGASPACSATTVGSALTSAAPGGAARNTAAFRACLSNAAASAAATTAVVSALGAATAWRAVHAVGVVDTPWIGADAVGDVVAVAAWIIDPIAFVQALGTQLALHELTKVAGSTEDAGTLTSAAQLPLGDSSAITPNVVTIVGLECAAAASMVCTVHHNVSFTGGSDVVLTGGVGAGRGVRLSAGKCRLIAHKASRAVHVDGA